MAERDLKLEFEAAALAGMKASIPEGFPETEVLQKAYLAGFGQGARWQAARDNSRDKDIEDALLEQAKKVKW